MHYKRKFMKPLWLCFFLLFEVHANEILDDIEVRSLKDLNNFDFGSYEEIQKRSSLLTQNIRGTVFSIPSSNGGIGSRTSYFVRGAENRHLLFTLDGMKLNDPSTVDRQFDDSYFLSNFLSQGILFFGPKSTLFGSDAVGGLVDLKLKRGEQAPYWKLDGGLGSYGTIQNSISKDWKKLNSRGTVGGAYFRTDGISSLNQKRFQASERDGVEIYHLLSSSEHIWNQKLSTDLTLSFNQGKSEIDGFNSDQKQDYSQNKRYLIQQRTNYYKDRNFIFSIRNGQNKTDRTLFTKTDHKDHFNGEMNQTEFLVTKKENKKDFIVGALLENEKLNQNVDVENAQTRSLYFQSKINFIQIDWHGGLRLDNHQKFGDFLTGTSGLAWKLDQIKLSTQYSQGYKLPTLYQLYGQPINGLEVGNQLLAPEKVNSQEFNLIFSFLKLTYFQNYFSDLITYTTKGYINQDSFRAQGLELSSEIVSNQISLKPFWSYTDFSNEQTPALRRPNLNYGFNFICFLDDSIEANAGLKYYSTRKDLDKNGELINLHSYELFQVGINFNQKDYQLGLTVENLFNRFYEEAYGYNTMPRSYFFNYSLIFY